MKNYLLQVIVAFDQLLNALRGGWADETISAAAYRAKRDGRRWGFIADIIDFFASLWQDDHCRMAYEAERLRQQFPPEYRRTTPMY